MRLCITILTLLLFVGCGAKPTHMEMTIRSFQDLNLDSEKISSPLMLKFYELKSAEKFSKLDFWTLLDHATEKLEQDLVSQSKHVITPNEEQTYKILFSDEARFFGVIATFRDVDNNATWRFVKTLKRAAYNEIELEISKNQLREED